MVTAVALMTMAIGYGAMSAQRAVLDPDFAPLATPEGITMQPLGLAAGYRLSKEASTKLPRVDIAFGTAAGMTMYTYDNDPPGKPTCVGECSKLWPPASAPGNAKPVTHWSVITREDGKRQWAYKNKPLYTYVPDRDIGSVAGSSQARYRSGAPGIGPRGRGSASISKDKPVPKGWHVAMMYPVNDALLPGGFAIREVEDAMALALIDEVSGKTLYAFAGNPSQAKEACSTLACRELWQPYEAPRMGFAVGDFGIGTRDDGITQWTYKGRALFTYSGDLTFGYANGLNVDPKWQVAAVVRYFLPAEVTLQNNPKLGRLLATAEGKTLYRRNSYIYQSGGGHSLRRGDPIRPAIGRDLGTNPRCRKDCEMWQPFLAPPSAQPSGDWSVFTRPDGSKQWAHRGYALWSYAGDQAPGDVNGNDIYDIHVNHDDKTVLEMGTPTDGQSALVWIAAYP